MEKLALGISLICLFYIILFYMLNWLGNLWEDEELSRRWSGITRNGKFRLRKLLNLHMKDKNRDFAH